MTESPDQRSTAPAEVNTSISVLTIVKGRQRQLNNQLRGLVQSELQPQEWVIVGMGESPEPLVEQSISKLAPDFNIRFAEVDDPPTGTLPLAEARNLAAQTAQNSLLVFLDVDCIPAPELLQQFESAQQHKHQLWMGTPWYLPQGSAERGWTFASLEEAAVQHPKLPALESDEILPEQAHEMFWSLCFSMTADQFAQTGGFDESFAGYGAEDTDFAFQARRQKVSFGMIGARAFHQYHSVCKPPLNHFEAIVANAGKFRQKWGVWPMEAWLAAFAERGLVEFSPATDRLVVRRSPSRQEVEEAITETPAGF